MSRRTESGIIHFAPSINANVYALDLMSMHYIGRAHFVKISMARVFNKVVQILLNTVRQCRSMNTDCSAFLALSSGPLTKQRINNLYE